VLKLAIDEMKALRIPSASALGFLRPQRAVIPVVSRRGMHKESRPPQVPAPIPLVPDVQTLLKIIGRGLSQHVTKFPTWEALFSLNSSQLKELGVEPPRTRRYLLRWLQKFRLGQFGIGGDFKHVEKGVASLRVLEVQKTPLSRRKYVVNIPLEKSPDEVPEEDLPRPAGYRVTGARTISGPFALPLKKRAGAQVTVTEGMWEDKRGRKIDGGERRQAEVRFKRRAAERRAAREGRGQGA